MTVRARLVGAALAGAATFPTLAAPAQAQRVDSTHTRDGVFRRRDADLALGLTAATIAIAPFDLRLTHALESPRVKRSSAVRQTGRLFDAYGEPGAMIAGPAIVLVGSALRSPATVDVGSHVTESYAAAGIVTLVLKGVAGRSRPNANPRRTYDFGFGRGYPHRSQYSSFPSGHATGAFAFAATLASEANARWPRHARAVGAVVFGGAALDGVSRVYGDSHWASDVAAGALIGTMSGILVTRFQHAHPNNSLDRLGRFLSLAPSPDGRLVIGVVRRF